MQRACFLLKVKKELLAQYLQTHKDIWPDMLDAIRDAGIRNYSMFFRGDELLVGYLEADDVRASLKRIAAAEAHARWQEHMAPYFQGGAGDLSVGAVEWLEQFFYAG